MDIFGLGTKELEILDMLGEDISSIEMHMKLMDLHLARMKDVRNKLFQKVADSKEQLPFVKEFSLVDWSSSSKLKSSLIAMKGEFNIDERWNKIAQELGILGK